MFQSPSIPPLDKGAYSAGERYTPADVQSLVAYAMVRGVRIVMELDSPGHASSWCIGDEAVCPSKTCIHPLNPATPKTYDLINNMVGELRNSLPDSLFHFGVDEVDYTCWTQVESIAKWMNDSHFTPQQAYLYFIERMLAIAKTHKYDAVMWDSTIWSMFGSSLPKELVIQATMPPSDFNKVTSAGYRMIFSPFKGFYLDQVAFTWKDTYTVEPLDSIKTEKEAKLVLGGEVTMWGENIDGSNLLVSVWPRTAAAAERLWSSRSMNDTNEFLPRLHGFRCRLLELDYSASPVLNPDARTAPIGAGSCSWQ